MYRCFLCGKSERQKPKDWLVIMLQHPRIKYETPVCPAHFTLPADRGMLATPLSWWMDADQIDDLETKLQARLCEMPLEDRSLWEIT